MLVGRFCVATSIALIGHDPAVVVIIEKTERVEMVALTITALFEIV